MTATAWPSTIGGIESLRECEMGVLGAMLKDNGVIDELTELRAEDFYGAHHQTVFRAIKELYQGKRRGIDSVTLTQYLYDKKLIDEIGGYGFIGDLLNSAPTTANARYYAETIRDKAIVRSVIRCTKETLGAAETWADAPGRELLEFAERNILGIADFGLDGSTSDLSMTLGEAMELVRHPERMKGIPTGFTQFDEKTGGLHSGDLILIGARPSNGKTSFGLCISKAVATEERESVFFVSLEQDKTDLAMRMLCMEAQYPYINLRAGKQPTAADMEILVAAGGRLSQYAGKRIHIDATPTQTVTRIWSNARRLKRRGALGVVVIDYLQLIQTEASSKEPRWVQIGQVSHRLKAMARELKVPVIVLAQLNRELEGRKDHRPRPSDLREAGDLEQDADLVVLLHRPELYEGCRADEAGLAEVIIGKQRNGPIGTVVMDYRKEFMMFKERDPFGDSSNG